MDIRSRDAYDEGHIEGAHHVELAEWAFPERLAELPTDKKIIVICDAGLLAAQMVSGLRLLGYDAAVPKTGINGWTQTPMTEQLAAELQSVRYPVKRVPPEIECTSAPKGAIFGRPDDSEYVLIAAGLREIFSGISTEAINEILHGGNRVAGSINSAGAKNGFIITAAALAYGMCGWTRTPATYLYLKDIQKADNPLV